MEGIGLHSGGATRMKFRPAPIDHGIVFRRTDLEEGPRILARVEQVVESERGTTLEQEGARVRTVEHVLAAVIGSEIDNVMIELEGPEPPAGDGSAARFVELIKEAGIEEQGAEATVWSCENPFSVSEGSSRYKVSPCDGFVISGSIEFDHPCIGRQHAWCAVRPDSFADEIGTARTFGFLDDAAALHAAGMARGADMTNTIVLTPDGLLDGVELRYEDEFVRHKILDVVGDLALVGRRIVAHIVAERPGHRGNIALARNIVRCANRVENGQ